jgi:hypothetical protein
VRVKREMAVKKEVQVDGKVPVRQEVPNEPNFDYDNTLQKKW